MGFQFKKLKNRKSQSTQRRDRVGGRATQFRIGMNNKRGFKKPAERRDETRFHTHYTAENCWQRDSVPGAILNSRAVQWATAAEGGGGVGFVTEAELICDSKSESQNYRDIWRAQITLSDWNMLEVRTWQCSCN